MIILVRDPKTIKLFVLDGLVMMMMMIMVVCTALEEMMMDEGRHDAHVDTRIYIYFLHMYTDSSAHLLAVGWLAYDKTKRKLDLLIEVK